MADEDKKVAENAKVTEVTEVSEVTQDAKDTQAKPTDVRDGLRAGMTVRVHEKIKDVSPDGKERERVQVFEGIILGVRGSGLSRTMTVRKESNGYGVEKIYPVYSPVINKLEIGKIAKVRRAKLAFLMNPRKPFSRKLKEKKV